MRSFNVFSELVVPYPGETFLWIVNTAEIPQGETSVTVSPITSWPLDLPSYTVSPGAGTKATAAEEPGVEATFECDPEAPNDATQTIAVAGQAPIPVCVDANLQPGDYFIWQNDTNEDVIITPDENNSNFWPLPGQQHQVPANDFLTLQIPDDAEDGEYVLVVATESGGAVCAAAAQPKIIIGSDL